MRAEITKAPNLNTNGVVTTSSSDGTLGVVALPADATKYLDGTGAFTVPAGGGGLTVGTTAIASGTAGRMLFEGAGNVLQESSNLVYDYTNGYFGIGGGTPTSLLHVIKSSTSAIGATVENTSATSSADAHMRMKVNGASGGDPHLIFNVSGVQSWTAGIDNSDSDAFVIGSDAQPGTNNRLRILTTGATQLSTYGVGTFTGTTAKFASFDSSGNIIEVASPIPSTLGGTGVAQASASSTLTLSGAFGLTFTMSGTTSLTLPTSGTLLAGTLTTTRIPYYNGTALTDSANLVWDNTNITMEVGAATVASGGGLVSYLGGRNVNSYYVGAYYQNLNAGADADTEINIGANNDTVGGVGRYVALGINSSGYSSATYDGAPADAFLYNSAGNLQIFTGTSGKYIQFYTGGYLAAQKRAVIRDDQFYMVNAGTAGAPAIAVGGQTNGIFLPSSNTLGFSTNSVNRFTLDGTSFNSITTGGAWLKRAASATGVPAFAFTGSTTTGLGLNSATLELVIAGSPKMTVSATSIGLGTGGAYDISNDALGIGTTSPFAYSSDSFFVDKTSAAAGKVSGRLRNNTATGYTQWATQVIGDALYNYQFGTSYSTSGRFIARYGVVEGSYALSLSGANATSGEIRFYTRGNNLRMTLTDTLVLEDALNIATNTTTGSKIGTATTQKIGFWNATPIVQPASSNQAAVTTTVATTGATNVAPYGYTTAAQADDLITEVGQLKVLVNQLRSDLVAAGLIKGSA